MPRLSHRVLLLGLSALAFAGAAAAQLGGQRAQGFDSAEESRAALAAAMREQNAAEARSERLEAEAQEAQSAADRAAREAAALAARIQQAEAGIAAARARLTLIDSERTQLREELGREQRPLVRLTAALQQFSRRPVGVSLLRPGEVQDVVYLRAMLHSAVPQVQQGTAGLRNRIARAQDLRNEAVASAQTLADEEAALGDRRKALAGIETRQRLAARQASRAASREADRVLVLAEQTRDLDGLVAELDRAAALRARLIALPGPQMRPAAPQAARVSPGSSATPESAGAHPAPSPYILPVTGRMLAGFGAPQGEGLSRGLTLGPLAGAQVVAPAEGRIVFAGPYRGYGQIVIVEHEGGWTSLVTGLARSDVQVGEEVLGGAPLGVAGPNRPSITLELRRDGEAVNPLPYTG